MSSAPASRQSRAQVPTQAASDGHGERRLRDVSELLGQRFRFDCGMPGLQFHGDHAKEKCPSDLNGRVVNVTHVQPGRSLVTLIVNEDFALTFSAGAKIQPVPEPAS